MKSQKQELNRIVAVHRGILLVCVMCWWFGAQWLQAQETNLIRMQTRWAKDVSAANAHPEYPRPQMVRDDWLNLNGQWDYAITSQQTNKPAVFDGKILVPFPVESFLSGVGRPFGAVSMLWYERKVIIPEAWRDKRVWLHFGAVDYLCTVWINGVKIGRHVGGYDSFSFDITKTLVPEAEQEIVVAVEDPSDAGIQPRGKQQRKSEGTVYSPSSGIWQTVWMEATAQTHVNSLKIAPRLDDDSVEVIAVICGAETNVAMEVEVAYAGRKVQSGLAQAEFPSQPLYGIPTADMVRRRKNSAQTTNQPAGSIMANDAVKPVKSSTNQTVLTARTVLHLDDVQLWTPDEPKLYDLKIFLIKDGKTVDRVCSYFGMRKISLGPEGKGPRQILLNGKPLFLMGVLDQGYWPDGIYTAPTDDALRYDIEMAKRLGFNTCRKHVKVEVERWYYWCDKLGMLVMQDMPNGRAGVEDMSDRPRSAQAATQFERELFAMVHGLWNHPSVIGWTLFNQGWGQHNTMELTSKVKAVDPDRLVTEASGREDYGTGDIRSIHGFPLPLRPDGGSKRASIFGEFGGLGCVIPSHTMSGRTWHHKPVPDMEWFGLEYDKIMQQLLELKRAVHLSGAIYVQLADVEQEITGLMTYDREVLRVDADKTAKASRRLIQFETTTPATPH